MLGGFRQGVRDLYPIWERILAPETLSDTLALGEYATGEFRFPDGLWARVVYDFLLAYRARVLYRSHIAQSLAPSTWAAWRPWSTRRATSHPPRWRR